MVDRMISVQSRRRRPLFLAGAAVFVLLLGQAPLTASAQNISDILNRLGRLERDIADLNINLAGKGPLPETGALKKLLGQTAQAPGGGPAVAQMEIRLSQMEGELRAATGRSEEVSHQLDLINERLNKLVSDLDYRLGPLEQAAARVAQGQAGQNQALQNQGVPGQTVPGQTVPGQMVPGQQAAGQPQPAPGTLGTITQKDLNQIQAVAQGLPPGQAGAQALAPLALQPPAPGQPQAGAPGQAGQQTAAVPPAGKLLPEGTPRDRYKFAYGLLTKKQYGQAGAAFKEFLESHPDNPLSGNARFWLGQTHYFQGEHQAAAKLFLEGYQANPTGPKAPDSLLKLGMSLARMGSKPDACAVFKQLATDFPDMSGRLRGTMGSEIKAQGCR